MRLLRFAGALAVALCVVPQAQALPGVGVPAVDAAASASPITPAQSRIGYWRKRYDAAQYRRYRGNPGAQYELRQKRRNLCRNVPEMC